MSIITPVPQQSIITLYKQIPWDNTYKDIRLFDNGAQRDTYFSKLEKLTFTNCSIAKLGKSFRLQGNFNDFTEFTYLTFENPGLGAATKRYYAFITAIDFINVQTCEITYEIDWIQSYLFLFNIGSCLVEREHVSDDSFGKHTLPESLDTGEYVISSQKYWGSDGAVMYSFLADNPEPERINGVVTCVKSFSDTTQNLTDLKTILSTFNDAPERIVAITMISGDMCTPGGGLKAITASVTLERPGPVVAENGETYTIVNSKSRIYPYFFMSVDNFQGNIEQYHYENFHSRDCSFRIDGIPIPRPMMECSPVGYMTEDPEKLNQGMSVIYDNFPSCPYANDTFKAWVSQYGVSNLVSAGASVASTVMGIASAVAMAKPEVKATVTAMSMAAGAMNLGQEAVDRYSEYRQHKIHAQQMHGGIAQSGMNFYLKRIGFRFQEYRPKLQQIKRIDGFFTRYGYHVDIVKVPNIRGRQYVNYVKTAYAQVGGKVPVDAKNCMENALNGGTSFWHVDDIGMQLSSNPIV